MSHLLRTSQYFVHIDYKAKQGLFYQLYSKDGYLKSTLIHNYCTPDYAATLDDSDSLHVISKTLKNQMLHIDFTKGVPKKNILLEDPNAMYDFSHLALHCYNQSLYFFYTVAHPTGHTRSLMYQTLYSNQEVEPLIHQLPHNTIMKSLCTSSGIYILYTDFKEQYSLNIAHLTTHGITHHTLYTNTLPIIDFNFCLNKEILHVVYVQDAYGKQKAFYKNTSSPQEMTLPIPRQIQAPCIFTFSDNLWITYAEQSSLYMLLSVYASSEFSEPVCCTLEGVPTCCNYVYTPRFDVNGSCLHLYLTPKLRLGVITQLDLSGIHPDLTPTTELALLLDGLKYATVQESIIPQPPLPLSKPVAVKVATPYSPELPIPDTFPTTNPAVMPPIHQYTPPTPTSANLKSAKEAFMNHTPMFDATPK